MVVWIIIASWTRGGGLATWLELARTERVDCHGQSVLGTVPGTGLVEIIMLFIRMPYMLVQVVQLGPSGQHARFKVAGVKVNNARPHHGTTHSFAHTDTRESLVVVLCTHAHAHAHYQAHDYTRTTHSTSTIPENHLYFYLSTILYLAQCTDPSVTTLDRPGSSTNSSSTPTSSRYQILLIDLVLQPHHLNPPPSSCPLPSPSALLRSPFGTGPLYIHPLAGLP